MLDTLGGPELEKWVMCSARLCGPALVPSQQLHVLELGAPRNGCSTTGEVSQRQKRGGTDTSLTCWAYCFWYSPEHGWLSGLKVPCSYWVFHQLTLPSPSPQGCPQHILCLACTGAWDCLNLGVRPCTWPCWTNTIQADRAGVAQPEKRRLCRDLPVPKVGLKES